MIIIITNNNNNNNIGNNNDIKKINIYTEGDLTVSGFQDCPEENIMMLNTR